MTTPFAPYPDVAKAVCDLLSGLGATGIETPQGLKSQLPYIRVGRTGDGGSDRVIDRSIVSVDVFDADATTAKSIAEQARQLLLTGLPAMSSEGLVDWAHSGAGPSLLPPTDSDNLRLVAASYAVEMRR